MCPAGDEFRPFLTSHYCPHPCHAPPALPSPPRLLFHSIQIKGTYLTVKKVNSNMSGMSHGGHGGLRPTQPSGGAYSHFNTDANTPSPNFNHFSQASGHASVASPMSPTDSTLGSNLLQDSLFPEWAGAPRPGMDSPDEMQRKDPLATQIWKLYSRTKSQLPNQERMENLTWRMMAMSLKRKEQGRADWRGYGHFLSYNRDIFY